MWRQLLFLLNIIIYRIESAVSVAPLVVLPNGVIQGREYTTINNNTIYTFEKIPYAAPPVGNLRFKAPIPPQNWKGILNTTHLDVGCYQLGSNGDGESEDCLFLNVYTPQVIKCDLPSEENNSLLPVMLFIHGGAFLGGSSKNRSSDIIVENDVILVTINYRLGIFGFLSTQDEVIPGNNGLKDQQLALQWTHNNIQLFGGDPEQITIFGQSAGSASCAYHLLYQQNKGLFRGAILESGTFLSPWTLQRHARDIAFDTASIINQTFANSDDSVALLEFLQSVDALELNRASAEYKTSHSSYEDVELFQGLFWAPVIEVKNENAFITEKMYGLLKTGNTVQVPIIIGTTSEETLGLREYTNLESLQASLKAFDAHLDWLVPNDTEVVDYKNRSEIGRVIRDIYTGGEAFLDHLGDGVRYYSDNGFTRSIIKTAEMYSKFGKTWYYQFSYDGEIGHNDLHYDGAESVGHSEDLAYLFCRGIGCDFSGYPESDQITVKRMVSLWTNFAKYLNPTPKPIDLLQNVTWPVVSTKNGDFLYLNINETLEIKNHPKENTFEIWVAIYDSLGYDDFDTY